MFEKVDSSGYSFIVPIVFDQHNTYICFQFKIFFLKGRQINWRSCGIFNQHNAYIHIWNCFVEHTFINDFGLFYSFLLLLLYLLIFFTTLIKPSVQVLEVQSEYDIWMLEYHILTELSCIQYIAHNLNL